MQYFKHENTLPHTWPNYSRKAQAPTTKLKTEITSEPSKITQLSAGYLSQLKRKLGCTQLKIKYIFQLDDLQLFHNLPKQILLYKTHSQTLNQDLQQTSG